MKKFAVNNIEWDTLTDDAYDSESVPSVDHCVIEVFGYDHEEDDVIDEILSDALVTDFEYMHMGFTKTLLQYVPDNEPNFVKVIR